MKAPTKRNSHSVKVAILVTDGFEQVELTGRRAALKKGGFKTHIVSPNPTKVKAMIHDEQGLTLKVDVPLARARAQDFDALLLPGGVMNPDALRMHAPARWTNKKVVVDGDLVTSRKPNDIPAFTRKILRTFAGRPSRRR